MSAPVDESPTPEVATPSGNTPSLNTPSLKSLGPVRRRAVTVTSAWSSASPKRRVRFT